MGVATIQIKTLKIDEEQVFMRTVVGHELVGPKLTVVSIYSAILLIVKGQSVKIHLPGSGRIWR